MDPSDPYISLINEVVQLYRAQPGADECAIADALVSAGQPHVPSTLAAIIVPLAFGRLILNKLGVHHTQEFLVQTRGGAWVAYSFADQPISRAALRVAVATFVHGPRENVEPCATRSAELSAANNALNAGEDIACAQLQPPRVFGVWDDELGGEGRLGAGP